MINLDELKEFVDKLKAKPSEIVNVLYQDYYSKSKGISTQSVKEEKVEGEYYEDKGWFFDKNLANYFKSIGKFLLKKGGDAIVVQPGVFFIDLRQAEIGQKNFVNVLNPQKYTFGSWVWINGKTCLGFSNRARLYFSLIEKKETFEFIKQLKDSLREKDIPFSLKYEQTFSNRNENCILYFNRAHYVLVFLIVRNLHLSFFDNDIFRTDVNMPFVKGFVNYKGIWFAEDPEDGSSFGEQRCQVIAEALISVDFCLEDLKNKLVERGYNPDKFYLNAFTSFPYDFGVWELRGDTFTDNLGTLYDNNLEIVRRIIQLILKNFIVHNSEGRTEFDILECKNESSLSLFDSSQKTIYRLCSVSEKVEILAFMVSYLETLKRKTGLTDGYIFAFLMYATSKLERIEAYGEIKVRVKNLKTIYGGGYIDDKTDVSFLELEGIEKEKYDEYYNNLINNFKHRGVVSYLPNDEFIVSLGQYGYAYIGTQLLKLVK